MPNGANPAGSEESVNDFTKLKVPSYTSTFPFASSAAYKKFPEALFVIASPVYTDFLDELSTARIAWLAFVCGAQPLMVPSSVANRKNVDHPPSWKSEDPLNTIPVGVPGPFNPLGEPGPFPAVGISTFSDCIFPRPSYRV